MARAAKGLRPGSCGCPWSRALSSEAHEAKLFSGTQPPTRQEVATLVASMPPLAGAPLEGPKFHQTNWQQGQIFTEQDDPDRTALPWHPPSFLRRVDPKARAAEATVQELKIPSNVRQGSFARVIRGALTEAECAELVAHVNGKGWTPALLNIGKGLQQLVPVVRDGHRIVVDSPELTNWLTEVLRPYLPESAQDGARLESLNERCRFLCYTPGQIFEAHCDGRFRRPAGHPKEGDSSRVTVQLYLHDVPASHGGATTFPSRRGAERDETQEMVAHQPEAGSVLLFTQNLLHEGALLKAGLKYTLRTEAMYTFRDE